MQERESDLGLLISSMNVSTKNLREMFLLIIVTSLVSVPGCVIEIASVGKSFLGTIKLGRTNFIAAVEVLAKSFGIIIIFGRTPSFALKRCIVISILTLQILNHGGGKEWANYKHLAIPNSQICIILIRVCIIKYL